MTLDPPDSEGTTRVVGPPAPPPSSHGTPYLIVLNGQLVGELLTLIDGSSYVIGRSDYADFRLFDAGISRRHVRVSVDGDHVLAEDLRSTNGTRLNGEPLTVTRELADGDKISIGTATIVKFTWYGKLPPALDRGSHRDPLTGAYRERYFDENLHAEYAYSRRHQTHLSLLLFDVDHFHALREEHGQDQADRLLVDVVRRAAKLVANQHLLARLAVRRFAILCRDVAAADARGLAEELRRTIAVPPVALGALSITATISVGVASLPWPLVDSADAFVKMTEYAVVDAKNAGHNRVVTVDQPGGEGTPPDRGAR